MSAVDPNRYAQPLEATMLRGQVASDQDKLMRNEACVRQAATTLHDAEQALLAAKGAAASARAYLEDIKVQGQGIRQRLLRAHGLLHPVRRLPDEILGEVMLTLLHIEATRRRFGLSPMLQASQRVPFTLSAVCKRWRSVAHRTPRLWASVSIDLAVTKTRPFMTSERPAAWLGFLKTHAAYSKGAEIDLQLKLVLQWTAVPVDIWSVIQELARFARSATFYMPGGGGGPNSDPPMSTISSYWFRNLLDLHISAIDCQNAGILREFPANGRHLRLRSLKVDAFWPSWDEIPDLPMCTSASFRPIAASVTLDDLALLAIKLPIVEDLDLGLINTDFHATSESGLSTVEFANVIKFCFTVDQDVTLFTVRLPKLQDVSVWLEAEEGTARESALIHHLKHSFNVPTLRRLCILPHSFGMNADVARALSGTTALKELSLKLPQDGAVSPSFLAQLSNPTTSGDWLCPKLRLLEVESYMADVAHRPAVESAFLELLSARRASSRDSSHDQSSKTTTVLREARLRWYNDTGHIVKDDTSVALEAQVRAILKSGSTGVTRLRARPAPSFPAITIIAMDANRWAGASEAALLREQLADDEQDCARVEARLQKMLTAQHDAEEALRRAAETAEAARVYVAELQNQRDAIAQRIVQARGKLHPIRRLPDEILGEVFCTWLDITYEAHCYTLELYEVPVAVQAVPFYAAAVCKRWRAVAHNTPALWSLVTASLFRAFERPEPWLDFLKAFNLHSKPCALTLRFQMDQGDESLAPDVFNEIRALTRRARVARIELPALPNPGSQVWHILLMESHWPILEKFSISAIPNYETGILGHIPLASSLTTLYLKDFWLEWSAVDPIIPSLKTVTLAPSHIRKISPRHLVTAVEKMPNVEELELVAVELSTRHPVPVTLLCPKLHKLRVRLNLSPGSETVLTFRVPSLLEAKFKLMDWGRPGVALHLLRTSLNAPALRRLSLATYSPVDEQWLRALEEFRCLEELRLKVLGKDVGRVAKEFLEGFTVAGPSGWTCPRLVCLRLKYSYSYYDWVPPALLKLVRARNTAAVENAPGGPARLRQVTLRWVQSEAAERVDAFEASLRELLSQ